MKTIYLAIICFTVLFGICKAEIDNKIPQPILNQTAGFSLTNYIAKQYETFTIDSLPLSYTIGSVVLQRPRKADEQVVLDPKNITKQYKDQFVVSEKCKFNDPDFNMTEIWQQLPKTNSRIIDYFLDQDSGNFVILTETSIEGYTIAKGQTFNFRGMAELPKGVDIQKNTHFITIGQYIAICSGKDIYKLKFFTQAVTAQVKIEIELWQALQFGGIIDADFELKRMIYSNSQIVALGDTFLKVFKYNSNTNKFQKVQNKHQDSDLTKLLAHGQFVDVYWQRKINKLYVLTDLDGIIQIRNFNTEHFKIVHHQIGQLGICQRFEVFNEFLEIIFKTSEKGQLFVAQFYIDQTTSVDKSKLILNRFYNKIYPARDVQKFGPHLFILSDNQFRAYGPGVNRKIYLENDFDQAPYIGYNYDIKWINVVEKFSENYQTSIKVIGFSQDKLRLFQINKLYPNTTCSFSKDTDVWVQTWGSCPDAALNKLSFIKGACRYDSIIHISIENELEWWQATLITGGVIAIIVFCACLNWAFIAELFKGKGRVNKLVQKMNDIKDKLKSKGQGSTWSNLNQKNSNKQKGRDSELAQSEIGN